MILASYWPEKDWKVSQCVVVAQLKMGWNGNGGNGSEVRLQQRRAISGECLQPNLVSMKGLTTKIDRRFGHAHRCPRIFLGTFRPLEVVVRQRLQWHSGYVRTVFHP